MPNGWDISFLKLWRYLTSVKLPSCVYKGYLTEGIIVEGPFAARRSLMFGHEVSD